MQQPETRGNASFHIAIDAKILDLTFCRHQIRKPFFYQNGMLLNFFLELWPNIFAGQFLGVKNIGLQISSCLDIPLPRSATLKSKIYKKKHNKKF